MFAPRYYGNRHYAPRYFGCGTESSVVPVDWVAMVDESIGSKPGLKVSSLNPPALTSHTMKQPGLTGHTLKTV